MAARWLLPLALLLPGCIQNNSDSGRVEAVWGRSGITDGRFEIPRAITIDRDQRLYIVDKTARIQVFKTDGTFLRSWSTPDHANGKPTGLSIDGDGNLMVADTHYFHVLVYSPEGKLLKTLGGKKGEKPGEFGFVTGTAQDSRGNLYVSEYGEYDRIQKFTPEGQFLLQWGGHGSEPGQFVRPQKIVFDEAEHLWVTDAGNHRIQVFDTQGKLLRSWGKEGKDPGELYYPYDIVLAPHDTLYICEYGNHRVQKFTRDGHSLGCWGHEGRGREPGELYNPWGLARDNEGKLYVLDTNNNRVQCVRFE